MSLSAEGQRAFSGPAFPPTELIPLQFELRIPESGWNGGFTDEDSSAGDSVSSGVGVETRTGLPVFVDRGWRHGRRRLRV
ncbi:hypothetical protein U1Q18_036609 [Sarracenia purpurea var. burkii]